MTSQPAPQRQGEIRALIVSQYRDVRVGGAERYVAEVSSRLPSQGIQVRHLAADSGELSPARWHAATSSFHPGWAREFFELLQRERPDVLYVHHTVPGLADVAVRVAQSRALPVALMYHSDITGPSFLYRLAGKGYDTLLGHGTLQAADEIHVGTRGYVPYSDALRNLNKPFVETPPGVDAVMAQGVARPGPLNLLFVGKPDVPSKGFPVLLEAWKHLRAAWPDLQLKVIGPSSQLVRMPGLHWLGQVESRHELADHYASATLSVLPSTSSAESFGMVLAEALVAGSPVVGSRVGGIPALIDEGHTGLLAEPGSVSSLIQALSQALRQHEALRQNVLERQADYLSRFNWEQTTANAAQSLHRLARAARLNSGAHVAPTWKGGVA